MKRILYNVNLIRHLCVFAGSESAVPFKHLFLKAKHRKTGKKQIPDSHEHTQFKQNSSSTALSI